MRFLGLRKPLLKREVEIEMKWKPNPDNEALLGAIPDSEIARREQVSVQMVGNYRRSLGITMMKWKPSSENEALLGSIPDSEIARREDVSTTTVSNYRKGLGVNVYTGPLGSWQPRPENLPLLGQVFDAHLARLEGVSPPTVRSYRIAQGVPAYIKPLKSPKNLRELLGTMSDRVLAKRMGRDEVVIKLCRESLGIPEYKAQR
jgi:DNA-binding CsgD family transcriptional regulator